MHGAPPPAQCATKLLRYSTRRRAGSKTALPSCAPTCPRKRHLQSAWLEAVGKPPTATVNLSRSDRPFANLVQECLNLVGAPDADEVRRRQRDERRRLADVRRRQRREAKEAKKAV
jgi:hypothetical protein